jgi:lysophospholipase L1-like esterase
MKKNRNLICVLALAAAIRLASANPTAAEPATNQFSSALTKPLASGIATNPVPRPAVTNWIARHNAFVAEAKKGGIDLLFLGDSITAGWSARGLNVWNHFYAPRHAASFGIGGDHTQHVLWRIENGELDGLKPKVVVLLIGTNNSSTDDPGSIAVAIKLIIRDLHAKSPGTKILLLAIFPRNKPDDQPVRMQTIQQVNALIAKFDDGQTVRFLDLGPKFLGPDGKVPAAIMPDFLHPNEKGYQIWADSIESTLVEMLK